MMQGYRPTPTAVPFLNIKTYKNSYTDSAGLLKEDRFAGVAMPLFDRIVGFRDLLALALCFHLLHLGLATKDEAAGTAADKCAVSSWLMLCIFATVMVMIVVSATVRLLNNITQSLIRSYEPLLDEKGKKVKSKSPTGDARAFLEQNMPFGSQMATWLAHTKEKVGAEAYDKLWDESITNSKRAPTKELSGNQDYLDFAAQPSFDILRKYYVMEEPDWCECMLPSKLVEVCDEMLAA